MALRAQRRAILPQASPRRQGPPASRHVVEAEGPPLVVAEGDPRPVALNHALGREGHLAPASGQVDDEVRHRHPRVVPSQRLDDL